MATSRLSVLVSGAASVALALWPACGNPDKALNRDIAPPTGGNGCKDLPDSGPGPGPDASAGSGGSPEGGFGDGSAGDGDVESGAAGGGAGGGTGGSGGSSTGGGAGCGGSAGSTPVTNPTFVTEGCAPVRSCDFDFGYTCNEFNSQTSAAEVQSSCTQGGYAEAPCELTDAVGGCIGAAGKKCSVIWYYAPVYDAKKAASQCAQVGLTPVSPTCDAALRCDLTKTAGKCAEYDSGYDPKVVQAACGSANFSTGACSTKDAEFVCLLVRPGKCARVVYQKGTAQKKASEDCASLGGSLQLP